MKTLTIAGNVGKDAVLRRTQQGDPVLGFPVAVDDGFGDAKRTLWFDCSVWGKRAEKLEPYVKKGGKVCVSGDLSTREHEGKTYLTIRVSEVTLQGGGQADPLAGRQQPRDDFGGGRGELPGDEIPFGPETRV